MAETTPATPQRKIQTKSSEDWDEELSFGQVDGSKRRSNDASPQHGKHARSRLEHVDKGESSPRTPQRNIVEGLRAWSESPTSPRHRTPHGHGPNRVGKHEDRENWDDDFLDSTDSPVRPSAPRSMATPGGSHSRTAHQPRAGPEANDAEEENWDEDFEMGAGVSSPGAGPSSRSKRSRHDRGHDAAWDSSDDEIEDFDREMGFDRNDEEDKTVTSRSRRKPLSLLTNDVPPLPPLPNFLPTIPSGDVPGPYTSPPSPFPRSSPSHSVFSIPATTNSGNRDSTYGSTAHLALSLRRTHSAESSPSSPMRHKFVDASRFPASTEAPRERRRLRKKSRPPHLDSSILELDDRPEPSFLRPSTPESRPCTPPPPSSGAVLSPTTPSSSTQASSLPPVPMSPTSASKSPLLARIGSMRRWGRKRSSISQDFSSTTPEAAHGAHRHAGSSPTANGESIPPSSFLAGALDAEADRFDNNRTPRPHAHVSSVVQAPPASTMPPPPPTVITGASVSTPRTPSRNRFFRGVSGAMEVSTPASSRSSLAVERPHEMTNRAKSREREQLRVAIPGAIPLAAQSSQSGDSELGGANLPASPRRDRIRAFGQKLLHSKRSASASSPDRGKDSSEGEPSRMSMHGYSQTHVPAQRQVSTPLSGETPTRLRPRIPGSHQIPSSLGHGKARQVFPRHVSGSALKERRSNSSFVGAPGMGSRSISATDSIGTAASSDDLAHSSDGHKASDEKGGHRGLMGSMRRISLVGAHVQKLHQELEPDGSRPQSRSRPRSPIPPLPPIPTDPNTLSNQLLPALGISSKSSKRVPSAVTTTTIGSGIDLTSPTAENAPSDWLSSVSSPIQAPGSRRSGDLPALTHSKSSSFATSSSSPSQTAAHRLSSASQAASLGRASPLPTGSSVSGEAGANMSGNVFRRNSLGDLKIPTRISKAQDGLKRDLGRVREFASRVEQMQDLRTSYFNIATQIQLILDAPRPPSRATSPTANIFSLSRSNSRARSNTNPPPLPTIDYRGLGLAFQAIDVKYSVAWECADLLIELGTGSVAESSQAPAPDVSSSSAHSSAPIVSRNGSTNGRGKNRERAVTLAGDEGKPDLSSMDITSPKSPSPGSPPALVSWRASTAGRHDLGHRQLYLLKEMLSNADSAKEGARLDIPELLTAPQFGLADEAMDSTLTLPTEESEVINQIPGSPVKKRRGSRLIGIRDMLRSLKRSTVRAIQNQPEGVVAHSSTTLNTDSSFDSHARQFDSHPYNTVAGIPFHPPNLRRKSETSAALIESMRSPVPDYNPFANGTPLTHKSSPRRPSLASLFRIGQKHKAATSGSYSNSAEQNAELWSRTDLERSVNRADTSREGDASDDIDDSDWDRMDSMSDVDAQLAAIADGASGQGSTLKQRKKKQQNRLSMPPPRPITPKHNNHPFSASQGSFTSVDQSLGNARSPRLSNVDENNISMTSAGSGAISGRQTPATPESSRRSRSRAGKDKDRERQFSSVRTVPPKPSKGIPSFDAPGVPLQPVPDLKLAMTPENIKPLLENARVVTARLHDCLAEVKGLLIRTEGSTFTISTAASSSNVALGPST